MQTLSTFLIVKNEEKFIASCLNSIKDISDEIVIVDTGSTDNTLELIKQFNVKLYHYKWNHNFSDARNFALKHCSKDLILYIDADEKLTENSRKIIKQIKLNNTPNKIGYLCKVKSISLITHKATNQMSYPRLFNNSNEIAFRGAIHEQILESLLDNNYIILNSDIEILHYGYDYSKEALLKKAKRNLEILLNNPEINWYYCFQLAQTYSILGNNDEAFIYMNKALDFEDIPNDYKSHIARYIADYYLNENNLKKALEFIKIGLLANPAQPLLNLVAANYYYKIGNFKNFIKHIDIAYINNQQYLQEFCTATFEIFVEPEKIIYFALNGIYTYKNFDNLNFYLNELQKIDSRLSLIIKKIISQNVIDTNEQNYLIECLNEYNIDFLANILQNYNHLDIAETLLKIFLSKFNDNTFILNALSNIYITSNNLQEAKIFLEKSFSIDSKLSTALYLAATYIKLNDKNNYKKIFSFIKNNNNEIAKTLPQDI